MSRYNVITQEPGAIAGARGILKASAARIVNRSFIQTNFSASDEGNHTFLTHVLVATLVIALAWGIERYLPGLLAVPDPHLLDLVPLHTMTVTAACAVAVAVILWAPLLRFAHARRGTMRSPSQALLHQVGRAAAFYMLVAFVAVSAVVVQARIFSTQQAEQADHSEEPQTLSGPSAVRVRWVDPRYGSYFTVHLVVTIAVEQRDQPIRRIEGEL